jgi:hypothetical protein
MELRHLHLFLGLLAWLSSKIVLDAADAIIVLSQATPMQYQRCLRRWNRPDQQKDESKSGQQRVDWVILKQQNMDKVYFDHLKETFSICKAQLQLISDRNLLKVVANWN